MKIKSIIKEVEKGIIKIAFAISLIGGGYGLGVAMSMPQDREPPKPAALEERLKKSEISHQDKETKYAVLVGGLSTQKSTLKESRIKDSLNHNYQILQKNGYSKENIIVLDDVGERNDFYPVDGPASKEAIKKVFEYLAKNVSSKDSVLFEFIDHGNRIERVINGKKRELSTLCLPGEDIDQVELADLARKINPKEAVFLIDACYSGGFVNELSDIKGKSLVALSSTTPYDETSTSNSIRMASFYFADALNNRKIADKDKDGKISTQEAFDYMFDQRYPQLGIDRGKKYIPRSGAPQIKGTVNTDKIFF